MNRNCRGEAPRRSRCRSRSPPGDAASQPRRGRPHGRNPRATVAPGGSGAALHGRLPAWASCPPRSPETAEVNSHLIGFPFEESFGIDRGCERGKSCRSTWQPGLETFEVHHFAVLGNVIAHREQRVEPPAFVGGIKILPHG